MVSRIEQLTANGGWRRPDTEWLLRLVIFKIAQGYSEWIEFQLAQLGSLNERTKLKRNQEIYCKCNQSRSESFYAADSVTPSLSVTANLTAWYSFIEFWNKYWYTYFAAIWSGENPSLLNISTVTPAFIIKSITPTLLISLRLVTLPCI